MLIDTHAHLDEQAFETDVAEVVARAIDCGVKRIFSIGITAATSRAAVDLAQRFEAVSAVVGVQPNYVTQEPGDSRDTIVELANDPNVVAIGETGLDRYWDHAPIDEQREWFDWHLELAVELDKPFIVHCRDADDDVVEQLQRFAGNNGKLRGVMHSFCGSDATADACLELGMHLSFSGMITYKKNDILRATAARAPLDRILVETDAPYLAPIPKRGKRNEPSFVAYTAQVLADARETTLAEIETATTTNAESLFRLSPTGE